MENPEFMTKYSELYSLLAQGNGGENIADAREETNIKKTEKDFVERLSRLLGVSNWVIERDLTITSPEGLEVVAGKAMSGSPNERREADHFLGIPTSKPKSAALNTSDNSGNDDDDNDDDDDDSTLAAKNASPLPLQGLRIAPGSFAVVTASDQPPHPAPSQPKAQLEELAPR